MLARDKHSLHGQIYQSSETNAETASTRAPRAAITALMGKLGLAREIDKPETDETKLARDLTDPAWAVRVEAAQQLGNIGKQAPLELLLVTLRDEQSSVRAAAARALGHNPRQAAIPALIATLDDPEWLVRVEVVMALGSLPELAPLEPLLTAAHDADAAVRAAAIWALGEVGTEQVLEQLHTALQDEDWSVREAATLALEQREELAARPPLLYRYPERNLVANALIQQSLPDILAPLPPETVFTPWLNKPEYFPASGNVQTSAVSLLAETSLRAAETPVGYVVSSHKNKRPKSLPATFKWPGQFEPQSIGMLAALILVGVLVSWLVIIAWPRSTQAGVQSALALTIYHGHNSSVEKLAWSPDGITLASADSRGMIRIWQANTGHTVTTYAQSGKVLALTWETPNTVLAAYARVNRTLQVEELTIESGYAVQQRIFQRTNLPGIPAIAAWAPDGETLAFDTGGNSVEIWNTFTHMYDATIQSGPDQFNQLIWSPTGDQLATLATNGIQIWDPSNGLDLQALANSQQAAAALWTPSNQGEDALLFISATGEITRWSALNSFQVFDQLIPQQTYNLENSQNFGITAIILSPDGEQLALATSDGIVQTRDATTLNLIDIYTGHSAQVNAIAWAPDGRSIATASTDTTVQVWQEL